MSKKILYVYTPDGKNLLHTYKDIKAINYTDNMVELTIENDIGLTNVSFSKNLTYFEIEPNIDWFSKTNLGIAAYVGNEYLTKFIDELIELDIIHRSAHIFSCDLIGMPKMPNKKLIIEWLYSCYDKNPSRNTLPKLMDKLYDAFIRKINDSNNAISSYY
jgi:hypothetical protein